MRIAVLLMCVVMGGCQSVRQINPGASIPIYEASDYRVQQEWRTRTDCAWRVLAFTDFEAREVWIVNTLPRTTYLAALANEQFHLADRFGVWEAAIMLEGGAYIPTCNDMPADAKAKAAAWKLARSIQSP